MKTTTSKLNYNLDEIVNVPKDGQGLLTCQLPISIPPIRGRFKISANVSYCSDRGNGRCGVGWEYEDTYIEFQKGQFYLVEPGYRTKVKEVADLSGQYRFVATKREHAVLFRTLRGWKLVDGVGTKYYLESFFAFGVGKHSVTRWYLNRIEDTNGNFAEYEYYEQSLGRGPNMIGQIERRLSMRSILASIYPSNEVNLKKTKSEIPKDIISEYTHDIIFLNIKNPYTNKVSLNAIIPKLGAFPVNRKILRADNDIRTIHVVSKNRVDLTYVDVSQKEGHIIFQLSTWILNHYKAPSSPKTLSIKLAKGVPTSVKPIACAIDRNGRFIICIADPKSESSWLVIVDSDGQNPIVRKIHFNCSIPNIHRTLLLCDLELNPRNGMILLTLENTEMQHFAVKLYSLDLFSSKDNVLCSKITETLVNISQQSVLRIGSPRIDRIGHHIFPLYDFKEGNFRQIASVKLKGPGRIVFNQITILQDPRVKEIRYNFFPFNGQLKPNNIIKFKWEKRSDPYFATSGVAFYQISNLLKEIIILCEPQVNLNQSQGQVVPIESGKLVFRTYQFTYQISTQSGRSILECFREYGEDGSTLPALKFSYDKPNTRAFQSIEEISSNLGWLGVSDWKSETQGELHPVSEQFKSRGLLYTSALITDLDGDGILEHIQTHHITESAKWTLTKIQSNNSVTQELPFYAGNDSFFSLNYNEGVQTPYALPGFNNRALFSLGLSIKSDQDSLDGYLLGNVIEFYPGEPLLVLPYRHFSRFPVYNSNGSLEGTGEEFQDDPDRWLFFYRHPGYQSAIFSGWGTIDVKALHEIITIQSDPEKSKKDLSIPPNGHVPLGHVRILHKATDHDPNEENYSDYESQYQAGMLIDLDGDGKLEYVVVKETGEWLYKRLRENSSNHRMLSFDEPLHKWTTPSGEILLPNYSEITIVKTGEFFDRSTTYRTILVDITGNGAPDILRHQKGSSVTEIFYNTGEGFVCGPTISGSPELGSPLGKDNMFLKKENNWTGTQFVGVVIADLNDDSILDRIDIQYGLGIPGEAQIGPLPGESYPDSPRLILHPLFADRWGPEIILNLPNGIGALAAEKVFQTLRAQYLHLADKDSHGKPGFLLEGPSTDDYSVKWIPGFDQRPDLLSCINNGVGHKYNVWYSLAGDFLNDTYLSPNTLGRFNKRPVVKEINEIDEWARVRKRSGFWYRNPHYQEFAGIKVVDFFREVEEFVNDGTYIKTFFNFAVPDVEIIKTYFDTIWSQRISAATFLSDEMPGFFNLIHEYKESGLQPIYDSIAPNSSREIQSETYLSSFIYGGSYRRQREFRHQQYEKAPLKPLEISYDYTPDGYEKKQTTGLRTRLVKYVTTEPFVSLEAEESILNSNGNVVQIRRNYFDNKPLGEAGTLGNLTKSELHIFSTTNPTEEPIRIEVSEFTYDTFGNLMIVKQKQNDIVRRFVTIIHDDKKLFTTSEKIEVPDGSVPIIETLYSYDHRHHRRQSRIGPTGLSEYIIYDGIGRPVETGIQSSSGSLLPLTNYLYVNYEDSPPFLEEQEQNSSVSTMDLRIKGPSGRIRRTFYSGAGRSLLIKEHLPSGRNRILSSWIFNQNGTIQYIIGEKHTSNLDFEINITPSQVHSDLNCTFFEYDNRHRVTHEYIGPLSPPFQMQFVRTQGRTFDYGVLYPNSTLTTTTDTSLGNRISSKITVTRDIWGRRLFVKDDAGRNISYNYDCFGRIINILRDQASYLFEYDSSGRPLLSRDPGTYLTKYLYDDYGNLALTQSWNWAPNDCPNILDLDYTIESATDVMAFRIQMLIDLALNILDEDEFLSLWIRYLSEWSVNLGAPWVNDIGAFIFRMKDALRTGIPSNGLHRDDLNNLLTIFEQKPNGRNYFTYLCWLVHDTASIARQFDALDRLRREVVLLKSIDINNEKCVELSVEDQQSVVTYRYDSYRTNSGISSELRANLIGRLAEIQTKSRIIEIGYDNLGNASQKYYLGIDRIEFDVRINRECSGRLNSITFNDEDTCNYKYDIDGFLKSLKWSGGSDLKCNIERDSLGRLNGISSDEMRSTYGFEGQPEIISSTKFDLPNGEPILTQDIIIDAGKRLCKWVESKGNVFNSYEIYHDGMDRLDSWFEKTRLDDGQIVDSINKVNYDINDNLISRERSIFGMAQREILKEFQYAPIQDRPHLLIGGKVKKNSFSACYDFEGAITSLLTRDYGPFSFQHDPQGRLNQIKYGKGESRFNYDGEGKLSSLISKEKHIEYFDKFGFFDHKNKIWGYHVGFSGSPLSTIIVNSEGTRRSLVHLTDCFGNIRATGEKERNGVWQIMTFNIEVDLAVTIMNAFIPIEYLPAITRGGNVIDVGNLQLLLFGSRAYIPFMEVFTSPDPFLPNALLYSAYNRYRFGYNSALNRTDPSGYEPALIIMTMILCAVYGAYLGYTITHDWTGALAGAIFGALIGLLAASAAIAIIEAIGPTTALGTAVGWGTGYAVKGAIQGAAFGLIESIGNGWDTKRYFKSIIRESLLGFVTGAGQGFVEFEGTYIAITSAGAIVGTTTAAGIIYGAFEGNVLLGFQVGFAIGMASLLANMANEHFFGFSSVIADSNAGSVANTRTSGGGGLSNNQAKLLTIGTRMLAVGGMVGYITYEKTGDWRQALAYGVGAGSFAPVLWILADAKIQAASSGFILESQLSTELASSEGKSYSNNVGPTIGSGGWSGVFRLALTSDHDYNRTGDE